MPHIPTADELRARLRDFEPTQQVGAEAKEALVAWNREYRDAVGVISKYAASPAQAKASDARRARSAAAEIDALTELVEDMQPVYKHAMGAAEDDRGWIDHEGNPVDGTKGGADGILTPDQWAHHVALKMRRLAQASGTKAVVSGSLTVPSVLSGLSRLPETAGSILELIPRKPITEVNYSYLQQTVRTTNAAPVADGATKPTSIYTVTEVNDKAEVVAHLSEPFPIRYFEDHDEVVTLLRDEMAYGLVASVEDQVVNGSGVSPEFGGITVVSGTTAVPFATDAITSLRKGRTALQVKGEKPTAFAMNPNDIEGLDLLRDSGATGGFLALEDRVFGRLPVIPSNGVPQGFAILADWSQARLYIRQQMTLDTDTASGFDTNEAKFRCELRANLALLRPQAFAVIDIVTP